MNKYSIIGVFLFAVTLSLGFVSAEESAKTAENGPCVNDVLDVGNAASEKMHNLKGFGPVEPATNGGNWGGLASMEDSNARVVWYQTDKIKNKTKDKPEATFILNGCNCHTNKRCESCNGCSHDNKNGIVLNVLDGIADDSFDVYVNGKKYYSYTSDPSTAEVWKEHNIDLSKLRSPVYSVKVVAKGTSPVWWGFNKYGQLAIAEAWSYC